MMTEQTPLLLRQLLETWDEITKRLLNKPESLLQSQLSYWQDYTALCQSVAQGSVPEADFFTDKRFKHAEWQNNVAFNFIKRSYLLLNSHIETLIQDISQGDKKTAQKLQFFTRQYMDAIAPTNFAHTNPEIITKTMETNGENLLAGLKQFLADLEGNGALNIKMTDTTQFKFGENIALTPGKVVYQNELLQLLQYKASTAEVFARPLLIIPPWINKYYILDLQAENSLVKWLVDQGFTVFMVSWANASPALREKEFADYLTAGALTSINEIQKITGPQPINVLGYCIGGTLLACAIAYLAKQNKTLIQSATFVTTLLDFSEPGELGAFIDEKQVTQLEKYMELRGYMDGATMASVFNALRANDLIWSSFVNNYLKGQKPKPFDLLYWNSDATNIPAKVHGFYLRNMYLENQLVQPNVVVLNGVGINLYDIRVPCYFLAAQDDHIVPWQSSYKSQQVVQGQVQFVLTSSGHVAGVVNPPCHNKYGYWTNEKNPLPADEYLATATFHAGSWWTNWKEWLVVQSGEMIAADGLIAQKGIEDAPGSYVRVKIADIVP